MRYSFWLAASVCCGLWLARSVAAQQTPFPDLAPRLEERGQVRASWRAQGKAGYYSTAQLAVADLRGDGRLCLVWPYQTRDGRNFIDAWTPDGTRLAGFPFAIEVPSAASVGRLGMPSIADLDGDGTEEILVSGTDYSEPTTANGTRLERHHVFICDGNGEAWPIAVNAPVNPSTGVTPVVDVDGNGRWDIVAGQTLTSVFGSRYPVEDWPLERTMRGYTPAIGDTNGDGKLEIYQPQHEKDLRVSGIHALFGFDNTGLMLPGWPQAVQGVVFNPSLGDVTGDGKSEVCVANGALIHLWTWNGEPLASTHPEGELTSVFQHATREDRYTCTALADLDGDGRAEILALCTDGRLYAWHGDGRGVRAPDGFFAAVPESTANNHRFMALESSPAEPVVADLGDDGEIDVVVGARWFTLKKDGSLVETRLSAGAGYAPSIVDLEGDGRAQIVLSDGLEIVVYETGLSYPQRGAQWPTTRGNFRRTGAWVAPEKRQQPKDSGR